MPTSAPRGYKVALRDDFARPTLDARTWFKWYGEPGSDPFGWWTTGPHVASRGLLNLRGRHVDSGGNPKWRRGGEVTSGVGTRRMLRFGEYKWCMKTDDMPGTSTVALLWPGGANQWPPEIDFFETKGSPIHYVVTLHYGTAKHNLSLRANVIGRNAMAWHVYTAIWKPTYIRVLEDGVVVATIAGSGHVPRIPMRFDIQTQAVRPGATVGSTIVDWVVEYAPVS